MSDDIRNDPEFIKYAEDVKKNLIPKLRGSACTVSIVPEGDTDVKFAVELGFSIMLDKPVIAVVAPGTKIPSKLALVADVIVEADWKNPEKMQGRIGEAIEKVLGPES
jgi:nucleoside 2-deoxyribosyltransferase